MTIRDDLRDAARDWLIAVTDATDPKVIDAGAKGPRPALPYVTVRVTSLGDGALHGPAERIDGLTAGNEPQATMRERREASISFQGFGSTAFDWLHQAQIRVDSPASLTVQSAAGIVMLNNGPVTDLSALLDTIEEQRCSFEMLLRHQFADDPVEQVALATTEVTADLERYTSDPDTLDASFALDADGEHIPPP